MFKRKSLTSFKKDKGCVITSERFYTNYCQVQGWREFVHVSSASAIMLRRVQNIVLENSCLKGKNWKFIFPWRKLNCHVLQIAKKAHFRYTIFFGWFMISEKSVTRCKLLHHRGTSMHQKTMAYQKSYISEFPVLSALKRLLCGLVAFIGMEHVYNYRRQ